MLQVLLQTLLPLSLFIIMLSIGLSISWRDFLRAFTAFRPLLLGTTLQIVGLPLLALLIITLFGLQGAVLFCILLFALALLPLLAIDEARGVATARRADEGARAGV